MYYKPQGLLVGSNLGVIEEKKDPHEKNDRYLRDFVVFYE